MTQTIAEPTVAPLAGFTIGVTAARRREELGSLLERRGARIVYAPALRIIPLPDDAELLAATRNCVETPLDMVVATTGIGLRGWIEAADGWGLSEALRSRLAEARLIARGPKVRGAMRAAGLVDEWSPESESMSEVLDHLLSEDLTGMRIAVQLHGEPLPDAVDALVAAGASVVEVPVYRWVPPDDISPLDRMIDQTIARQLDVVSFTSAPAVASMLKLAADTGREGALLDAWRTDVIAACVGPVTSAPLERRDVPVEIPDRARLGGLVRTITEALPRRHRSLPVAGHHVQVRGHAAVVDGTLRTASPGSMAVLKALAHYPGRVLSREALLGVMPGEGADGHAVEMAVARLRTALGDPRCVQTVVKRGYRLAYEPELDRDGAGELGEEPSDRHA